jgi:hypothetical protein
MAAGYTTTTSLAELVPEITFAVDLIYQDPAIGEALVHKEDITGQKGTTVEFPFFTEVAASTGVGETGTPTSHQLDISMGTATVARRSVYVGLGDLTAVSANATPDDIGAAMVMAMKKAIDTSIFSVTTGTTNYATSAGSTNAAMSITYALNALNELEKNEVTDDLNAVLHPFQFKSIRSALTPVANDDGIAVTIASDMARNAMVSRMFGMNWFVTNRVSSATVDSTGDVYVGLVFAKKGIGYGFKWMYEQGIEPERDAANALTKLVLNWADTSLVIQASAVCELYSTSS